ncbi:translation initiation factor IF-2 [Devosia insulae DS-56]|uniref:Translation initiation factor IF-2 n=1 Tax=Devosia insulae DS-56 TaxID=1116389 RepID=A0A1E5XVJ1_9HYPH|nr:translation initiation factor IF-2 [Devosia insulae]OEO32600.1 translation initiation factor IF-2 [Devosia insulae DS-56]
MADNDDKREDSGAGGKKTLSLKGGPSMGARPNVARSSRNTVVVEKRTRFVPPGAPVHTPHTPHTPRPPQGGGGGAPSQNSGRPASSGAPSGNRPYQSNQGRPPLRSGSAPRPGGGLSATEADARARALREAAGRQAEDEARARAEEARRIEEDARRRALREEAQKAEEAKQLAAEGERALEAVSEISTVSREPRVSPARRAAATPGARPAAPTADLPPTPPSEADGRKTRTAPAARPLVNAAELENARRGGAARVAATPERPTRRAGEEAFARARLTVTNAGSESDRDKGPSLAAMRRRRDKKMGRNQQQAPKLSREVTIPEAITVQELANRMAERAVDIIKILMAQGQMVKITDVIDSDTAELIATELGHTVKRVSDADVEEGLYDIPADDKAEDLTNRAPVVTIMGHVDHGKTSLLDAIRETNVVSGEAGGITQHIGAYQVEKNGQKITFLDTPGHEAFTAMRARGAQATDIAVLVVAADDGVMPQTIESIKHAKAAGVPIIVAINKMDKPSANPQRVRTELLQHEVFVESMGGDVLDVEVSAVTKAGLDKLLETILLQAEVLELKVARDGRAEGLVIEAKLDRGRGAVATVLVQRGTLSIGDIVVAGTEFARVRALINDQGEQVKEAGPSIPVEVLGFTGVPSAGDRFSVVESEARAREVTEYRQRLIREKTAGGGATSLEQMMNQLKASGIAKFPLIIKGDVQGSVEAINASLNKLSTDEVSAQILMSGVGAITESDVTLASASNAIIIGFNVRANKQASDLATREGIEIRYYNIIYDLVDDVKAAMSGLLKPERRETFIGYASIKEVFQITKVGKVAGCQVTEGIVERGAGVRLLRDNVVIHEGKLKTLKRFKDEVKEVPVGQECGMAFENYEDIRAGDVIECFRVESVVRSL